METTFNFQGLTQLCKGRVGAPQTTPPSRQPVNFTRSTSVGMLCECWEWWGAGLGISVHLCGDVFTERWGGSGWVLQESAHFASHSPLLRSGCSKPHPSQRFLGPHVPAVLSRNRHAPAKPCTWWRGGPLSLFPPLPYAPCFTVCGIERPTLP